MFRKRCLFVLFVIFAVKPLSLHAFETGALSGRVIDGFGEQISFADVAITSGGSISKITTDSSGNFSVFYSPGDIKLTIKKKGYVPAEQFYMIEEGNDLNLGDIVIWRIPPSGGLFVVGPDDYIKINDAEYYVENIKKEKHYYVKGSPTVIKGQDLRIIDFQTDNPLVMGKTLYRVDSGDSLGSIVFYPSQRYLFNKEDDTYVRIADNVGMRKIRLSPGRYFYCLGQITIRSRIGFGFFFEVR
ncbi:MAG: carboxypeptidase-like regulatory domain-containing protein [Candidatus Brocadiaceae bacterium]|nr:carboxypeptidase-like regulatory domain-containing protein [Candidatus Brocadiaceae bacterium]